MIRQMNSLYKGILSLLLVSVSALAQAGPCIPDARTRAIIAEAAREPRRVAAKDADGNTLYYPLIVKADSEKGFQEFLDLGMVFYHIRGNLALGCIPRDRVGDLGNTQYIDGISLGRTVCATVDVASSLSGIGEVHRGIDGTRGYDGTGVIAGVCDIGFDPDHIAFAGRVGMKSHYVDSLARRTVYAPGTSLDTGAPLVVDCDEKTHATHVTNIFAGGREGNPYYGVAPGTEIAVSTSSSLSDVALLSGIEDIISFARERDKPAVINLSMGSYLGPHDGTDLVNQYLDLLGKEAIICFSAGNNGRGNFSLTHNFSADGETIGSVWQSSVTYDSHNVSGALDIWSADDSPFDLQLVVWDCLDYKEMYTSEWIPADKAGGVFRIDCSDPAFGAVLQNSHIAASYGIDRESGRYNIYIEFFIDCAEDLPGGHGWGRYMAGWRVRGRAGTAFDAYTDGVSSYMTRYGVSDFVVGNTDQTISNLCCNDNTVSVGAWTSRTILPLADGTTQDIGATVNRVINWTSYGTLRSGRSLPHFCAPGHRLVSAMNNAFYEAHPDTYRLALEQVNGSRTNRWYGESGTSMSSPFTAGVFALWLEADPTLTVHKVRDIAMETARRNFDDIADPRWGAGAIDGAAGLRKVLSEASVAGIVADTSVRFETVGSVIRAYRGGEEVPVEVFTVAGARLSSGGALPSGIYIARAAGTVRRIAVAR